MWMRDRELNRVMAPADPPGTVAAAVAVETVAVETAAREGDHLREGGSLGNQRANGPVGNPALTNAGVAPAPVKKIDGQTSTRLVNRTKFPTTITTTTVPAPQRAARTTATTAQKDAPAELPTAPKDTSAKKPAAKGTPAKHPVSETVVKKPKKTN